jgi:UDP-N-acetylglucosamine--N-acetylmuramyl-(pentapeptide) pyrophosphoryl-undecaprenol N-acetylglucosamine transferase
VTTLFLAATGGHLAELYSLANRIPHSCDSVWVTHADKQSRSMLADRDVEFVPYVGVRNVSDVLRCIPYARRLMKRRKLTRAVSTGSGIALGYLPYLAFRGVICHYIESAARVRAPSLTGRILQWVPGVNTYTQYLGWSSWTWRYGGSVFDEYEPMAAARAPNTVFRVVVMSGCATQYPFRRLFDNLVPLLAPNGALAQAIGLPVQVLWQTGETKVDDLPIQATPMLPAADLSAELQRADLVISHAGTGSALAALEAGRYPILVPRDSACGEQVDDHQQDLAAELAQRGLAMHCDADRLTVDVLLATLGTSIRHCGVPPPYLLCGSGDTSPARARVEGH